MKMTIAALILAALTATASARETDASRLTDREAKELATAFEGKVAGKPVNCVSNFRGENLHAVGDNTLIYRINRNLIYRNNVLGTCRGLSFGDTLVLRVYGSQYCRGDIARVVNLQSGIMTGSCVLGDFVPYTPADAG